MSLADAIELKTEVFLSRQVRDQLSLLGYRFWDSNCAFDHCAFCNGRITNAKNPVHICEAEYARP